jgi:hypothetical protein
MQAIIPLFSSGGMVVLCVAVAISRNDFSKYHAVQYKWSAIGRQIDSCHFPLFLATPFEPQF